MDIGSLLRVLFSYKSTLLPIRISDWAIHLQMRLTIKDFSHSAECFPKALPLETATFWKRWTKTSIFMAAYLYLCEALHHSRKQFCRRLQILWIKYRGWGVDVTGRYGNCQGAASGSSLAHACCIGCTDHLIFDLIWDILLFADFLCSAEQFTIRESTLVLEGEDWTFAQCAYILGRRDSRNICSGVGVNCNSNVRFYCKGSIAGSTANLFLNSEYCGDIIWQIFV